MTAKKSTTKKTPSKGRVLQSKKNTPKPRKSIPKAKTSSFETMNLAELAARMANASSLNDFGASFGKLSDRQLITEGCQNIAAACIAKNANQVALHSKKNLKLYCIQPEILPPPPGSKHIKAAKFDELLGTNEQILEIKRHPALELLDKPSRRSTRNHLFDLTQRYLEILGRAYWLPEYLGGDLVALEILNPLDVEPVLDSSNRKLVGFRLHCGTNHRDLAPESLIEFRNANPADPNGGSGLSPLMQVGEELGLYSQLVRQERVILKNSTRPDIIVKPKTDEGFDRSMDEENYERFVSMFIERFSGNGNGGPLICNTPCDIETISYSSKDLAALKISDQVASNVSLAFGIRWSILNSPNLTQPILDAEMNHWLETAIKPRLNTIEDVLNAQYLALVDPTGRLFFAYDEIMPESQDLKVQHAVAAAGGPVMTQNEARQHYFDLGPIEGGDVIVSAPGGEAYITGTEPVETPPEAPATPEPPAKSLEIIGVVEKVHTKAISRENGHAILTALYGQTAELADKLLGTIDKQEVEHGTEAIVPSIQKAWNWGKCCHAEKSWSARQLATKAKKRGGIAAPKPPKDSDPRVKKLAEIVAKHFEILRKGAVGQLSAEKAFQVVKANDFSIPKDWESSLAEDIEPIYQELVEDSGTQFLAELGIPTESLDAFNENVAKRSKTLALDFCESTRESTSLHINDALASLRGSLTEGLESGDVLRELTARTNEVFDGLTKEWSQVIARTEASRAFNQGSKDAAIEAGIEKMQWLLAPDPCPECAEYEGLEVSVNEAFGTRGEGSYSVIDTPPLHPNCFCSVIYVVE